MIVPEPPPSHPGEIEEIRLLRKELRIAHGKAIPLAEIVQSLANGGADYDGTTFEQIELWFDPKNGVQPIPKRVRNALQSIRRVLKRRKK